MTQHQRHQDSSWLNLHYAGEDADDGCANELSLYALPDGRLQLLLTNSGFAGQEYDDTFSLDKEDARQLADFLTAWLNEK